MQLKDYLYTESISSTSFAKSLGVNRSYLCEIKNRRVKPSKHMAKLISLETHGKVTLDDLLKD